MKPALTSEARLERNGSALVASVLIVADRALDRDLWSQALAGSEFRVLAAIGDLDDITDATRDASPHLVLLVDGETQDVASRIVRLSVCLPDSRLVVIADADTAMVSREVLPERTIPERAIIFERDRTLAELLQILTDAVGPAGVPHTPPVAAGPPHFRPLAARNPSLEAWSELKPRERDVLVLLARGTDMEATARQLGVSRSTIEHYRSRLLKKFGFRRLPPLVYWVLTECREQLEKAAAALGSEDS